MRLLFNFFNKNLYKVKASGLQLSFNIFRLPSAWHKIKKKLYKTLNYWFRGILNSDFLEKGLGIVSTLLYMIFQEKCFSCYILLTDQISLSDCLLELLGKLPTANACFSGCDVINFVINLIFAKNDPGPKSTPLMIWISLL